METIRFVNDDVKLKSGGRNAIRISQNDLATIMLNRAAHHDTRINKNMRNWPTTMPDLILSGLCDNGEASFVKDNTFDVAFENFITDQGYCAQNTILNPGPHLMGFHTLSNGLTFYGFQSGGDCEYPMFMIIYHDGKSLRLYQPSYGNMVNLDLNCAFGSECPNNDEFNKIKALYKKLGVYVNDDLLRTEQGLTNSYLAKYGIIAYHEIPDCDIMSDITNADVCWVAIQKDIEASIVVI